MSRICVICMGTPAFVPCRRHHGPGKRASHFVHALVSAGHDVLVVAVDSVEVPRGTKFALRGSDVPVVSVAWGDFGDGRIDREVEEFGACAIVAATVHAGALAATLHNELPLWVDVFGDLMAEAQAKAVAHGCDAAIGSFWGTLVAALGRGDRFSCVCAAQADSLYGQLGMVGRLNAAMAGKDYVSVIPCATESVPPASSPRRSRAVAGVHLSPEAFVVLWSGSFNTWCDVDTAFAALERAMDESPSIHFVATGAGVPGHDERTFSRFDKNVRTSRHRGRYHLLGWLDESELAEIYASADVGLVVERDLIERRFGSENRVVEWLAHGLPCVTTARSALGRDLVQRGLAYAVPPADAGALAKRLVELVSNREMLIRTSADCRARAREAYGYEGTAIELVRWCESPCRAADRGTAPISIGLVSEPRTMVRLLEAYVDEMSVRQLAYRSIRWVWRRGARSIRGRMQFHFDRRRPVEPQRTSE